MKQIIQGTLVLLIFGSLLGGCKIPPNMKEFNAYMNLAQRAENPEEKIRYYDNALSVWRKGMPLEAKANAYCGIGIGFRQKKQYEQALRMITVAITIMPKNHIFRNERALVYSDRKEYDLALEDVEKSLTANPNFASAFFTRGNIYFQQNKYDEALKDMNRSIQLEPKFYPVYSIRAKTYVALGEDEKAIADFTKVIRNKKNSSQAYFDRGTAYGNTKEYDRAIYDLNKSIKLDPNNPHAYLYRGIFYFIQGKYPYALNSFDRMLRLDKDYVAGYLYRGFALLEMGEIKTAEINFKQVRSRDINNTEAAIGMALLSYYKGKKMDGIFFYKKAITLKPDYALPIKELIAKKEFFYLRHHGKALEYLKKEYKRISSF
ncbi:MAG TPA: tetratricopeptide repeat protein [Elusimicrobiales bacterium]|nr:tetratricopeptide repeat protein [Elusimicrobiales bacterium]